MKKWGEIKPVKLVTDPYFDANGNFTDRKIV